MMNTANCVFGWPNRADTATLSGGNWQTPLSNLQSPLLSLAARSADTSLSSTQIAGYFGQSRYIDTMAFCKHNLTLQAQLRWQFFADAAFSNLVWDSGWGQAWPSIYSTYDLNWEDDNFWYGQIPQEQVASIPAISACLASYPVPAPYFLISINDVNNPAGYVQIGRLYLCKAFRPQINMDYGASQTIVDPSVVEKAQDGTPLFERRTKYRVQAFKLSNLSLTEGNQVMSMFLDRGITQDFFFVEDPTDAAGLLLRAFPARFSELSALEKAKYNYLGCTHKLEELV